MLFLLWYIVAGRHKIDRRQRSAFWLGLLAPELGVLILATCALYVALKALVWCSWLVALWARGRAA
jgi:hypothetical protein